MSSATAGREPITVHRSGRRGAPVVVLVHGLTDDGRTWPDLVDRWAGTWDLHALDLRGHGTSPRFTDDELPRSPEVMLDDLLDVLDAQPEPVALVGHSLGGLLSLRASLARPAKVRALVLEDPARPHGSHTPAPDFVAAIEGGLDAAARDRQAEVERMRRETPWSETEIQAWADSRGRVDREYVRRGMFLGDGAWEEAFGALAVPTLLVLPPDAPMAPRPEGFDNPLVRTVVVEGAGHCVRRDRPEAWYAAVEPFLAAAGAPGASGT